MPIECLPSSGSALRMTCVHLIQLYLVMLAVIRNCVSPDDMLGLLWPAGCEQTALLYEQLSSREDQIYTLH